MNKKLALALYFCQLLYAAIGQNTPVIGGSCKTGTPDVQIGAKQTQFFLKCEANDDSQDGSGIWVVKSRAAAAPGSNENQVAQQHPQKMRKPSNVCEQDSSAREGQSCTTSETCLQQNYEQAGSYLQCDSTSQRWNKRNCQPDFVFSFEHQSCIGHTKTIRHVARQAASAGVICTYTNCNNNNNNCNIGTCNNGYCCSSAPIAPIQVTQSCPTCNNGPRIIQIRCPGGGMPYGTCNSGYCSAGYTCVQSTNMCCATVRTISTNSCPGNRVSVGSCMNGRCGSGYSCNTQSNSCCPNPTICPDGTQAAGACVNNQCGTGFTCTNNLCCTSSSTTPRCLDGTSAVGACINNRCGSGYTCTTGNICCPSSLTICPVGQVSIGVCVNGICPAGYTCNTNSNQCCGAANTITCDATDTVGPCVAGSCPDGYLCDTTQDQCCPNVDFNTALGPCIAGACPEGYLCVASRDQCFLRLDADGTDTDALGPCIDGLCPTGSTCDTTTNQCIPTTG